MRRRTAPVRGSLLALALLLGAGLAGGCGGDDAPDPSAEPPTTIMGAVEAARQAASAASARNAPRHEPGELRDRMPDRAAGLSRVELSTASGGVAGLSGTSVQARYEGDGGRWITAGLVDLAGVPGAAALAIPWLVGDFERTHVNGFERTMSFEGHRGFESEETRGETLHAQLSLMAGQVLVQIEGRGVRLEELKALARQLGLRDLAG